MCLQCHGTQIKPEVQKTNLKINPNDLEVVGYMKMKYIFEYYFQK